MNKLPRKSKKTSKRLAKKAAWDAFSKYIRLRDCLATRRSSDEGECVTCRRVYPIKQLQAGHFIPGRNYQVLFDEEQVHAQCYSCNIGKKGNWVAYREFMVDRYGKDKVEQMETDRNLIKVYSLPDLLALEEHYKKEYNELLKSYS